MSWLRVILLILKYGPAVFTLVSEIVELLKKLRDQGHRVAAERDLDAAVAYYRRTKDRRPLRRLRERLQVQCFGPDCRA